MFAAVAFGAISILAGIFVEFATGLLRGRVWGIFLQLALLAVSGFGGFGAYQYAFVGGMGELVPGDELVALLGKHRDSSVIQDVIQRLYRRYTEKNGYLFWQNHRLAFRFDDSNQLVRIFFGDPSQGFSVFNGEFPFGLTSNSRAEDSDKLFGEPDKVVAIMNPERYYKSRSVTAVLGIGTGSLDKLYVEWIPNE